MYTGGGTVVRTVPPSQLKHVLGLFPVREHCEPLHKSRVKNKPHALPTKYACQHTSKVPIELIIKSMWFLNICQRPTVQKNTTKQTWNAVNEMSPDPFASVNIYNWNCSYYLTCTLKTVNASNIITYKPHDGVWVTVHGVAIIYVHLQHLYIHHLHRYLNLGALPQPFARGTKQPYSYTGSDDSDSWVWWVFGSNDTTDVLHDEKWKKELVSEKV